MKKSVTPRAVVKLLNEMLEIDPRATRLLANMRVACNKSLENHPTIQVGAYKKSDKPGVGIIGVLNGLFGIDSSGFGPIVAVYDDDRLDYFATIEDFKKGKRKVKKNNVID